MWEPPAALSRREAPAFQLSQGLGPWTCSADNGASASVRRGDLEVLDRAPFLGLDREEVPPGLSQHGVKWGQGCNPGWCASQEGLEEAEARRRSNRGRLSCKGLRLHQLNFLQINLGWHVTCRRSHGQVGAKKQWRGPCPPLSSVQLCYIISHNPEKGYVGHLL